MSTALGMEQRRGNASELQRKQDIQRAAQEIPEALGTISNQIAKMQRVILQHADAQERAMKAQADERAYEVGWSERVHDRLDALLVETRVTNHLLAELVAVQKAIISDDTFMARRDIKADAYARILNGE